MNRHSVAAPRLRKSGEAEMTSILIETDTNSSPMSAPAAPPMTTAKVSHPGKAAPRVGTTPIAPAYGVAIADPAACPAGRAAFRLACRWKRVLLHREGART